jgi:hypothetical protein
VELQATPVTYPIKPRPRRQCSISIFCLIDCNTRNAGSPQCQVSVNQIQVSSRDEKMRPVSSLVNRGGQCLSRIEKHVISEHITCLICTNGKGSHTSSVLCIQALLNHGFDFVPSHSQILVFLTMLHCPNKNILIIIVKNNFLRKDRTMSSERSLILVEIG